MNCASCGKTLNQNQRFCTGCGTQVSSVPISQPAPLTDGNGCVTCGKPLKSNQRFCDVCGSPVSAAATGLLDKNEGKSKVAAALLAFFFGMFGVHNFYLCYTGKAVTQLILTILGIVLSFIIIGIPILSAVGIWVLVEMILLLCGAIKVDGHGRRLI